MAYQPSAKSSENDKVSKPKERESRAFTTCDARLFITPILLQKIPSSLGWVFFVTFFKY
jgi:hypothetical protein